MDFISTLYSRIGEDKLRLMVSAFYQTMRTDDLIGPMYPQDDWEGSEKRLADFMIFRFGGPQTYIEERGHPRLRARHMPYAIGPNERDRWLNLMDEAMVKAEIESHEQLIIRAFFKQVADMMQNRPN
jgi:hemoglobin